MGINTGFSAVQTYNYDSLNRLKDATEMLTPHGGSQSQSWKQTFTFDRYGNRNFDEANTAFAGFDKLCNNNTELCADLRKRLNPSINASNNRLSTSEDYAFDASGNTTADPDDRTFIYDAENKQVSVSDGSGTIGEYFYDGDGRRVKKVVPGGETTIFVYDAGSKLIGEYSSIVQTGTNAKTVYTTNDHLGSPRINTDGVGSVVSRHDYHPFGEEVSRTGYGSDTIQKQFTGYERDGETGLDFAQARYLASNHGRFSSPDYFMNDTAAVRPSSWNLYVYVLNNPLRFRDPTGKIVDGSRLTPEERDKILADLRKKTGYTNLSFNDKGILTAGDGKFEGGSKKARELLGKAIDASHQFNLIAANDSERVAFGSHEPGQIVDRVTGARTEYSDVKIDFKDFDKMYGSSDLLDSHSVGIVLLHEFVHGLFPNLQDGNSTDPGQLESEWINPIRWELGLPLRAQYAAREIRGARLDLMNFTEFVQPDLSDIPMCDPKPIDPIPVQRILIWQRSVGGLRR